MKLFSYVSLKNVKIWGKWCIVFQIFLFGTARCKSSDFRISEPILSVWVDLYWHALDDIVKPCGNLQHNWQACKWIFPHVLDLELFQRVSKHYICRLQCLWSGGYVRRNQDLFLQYFKFKLPLQEESSDTCNICAAKRRKDTGKKPTQLTLNELID